TVLGSIGTVLPGLMNALLDDSATPTSSSENTAQSSNSTSPFHGLHANPVPDLRLPEPVISSVQPFIGAGEVVQVDSQNLTLRNFALSMLLVGGSSSFDYLMYLYIRLLQIYWVV